MKKAFQLELCVYSRMHCLLLLLLLLLLLSLILSLAHGVRSANACVRDYIFIVYIRNIVRCMDRMKNVKTCTQTPCSQYILLFAFLKCVECIISEHFALYWVIEKLPFFSIKYVKTHTFTHTHTNQMWEWIYTLLKVNVQANGTHTKCLWKILRISFSVVHVTQSNKLIFGSCLVIIKQCSCFLLLSFPLVFGA